MGKKKNKKKKNKKQQNKDHLKTSSSGRTRATHYLDDDDFDYYGLAAFYGGYWFGVVGSDKINKIAESIFGSKYYCVGDGKKAHSEMQDIAMQE